MPGWSSSQVPLSSQSSLQQSAFEVQTAPDPIQPVLGGLTDWSASQSPVSSQSRLQHWAFEEHASPARLQAPPLGLSSASSPQAGICMKAKAKGNAPASKANLVNFDVVMRLVDQKDSTNATRKARQSSLSRSGSS